MKTPERTCPGEAGREQTVGRANVDLSGRRSAHSFANKLARVAWGFVWSVLFRPSPRVLHSWRRMLLRGFGAKIGVGAAIYPSCRIWAPWNLEMGPHSCLGFWVDCYCVDKVRLGAHAVVSQYSYLCSAGHDIAKSDLPLVTAPITIGDGAWVCADVFVGPGVTIGEGAVAAARSVVVRDVPEWTVVAGNPAKFIKERKIVAS